MMNQFIQAYGHKQASEAIEEAISFLVSLDHSLKEFDPELEMAVFWGEDFRSLLSHIREIRGSLSLASGYIVHDLWEKKREKKREQQQKQKSPTSSGIGHRA